MNRVGFVAWVVTLATAVGLMTAAAPGTRATVSTAVIDAAPDTGAAPGTVHAGGPGRLTIRGRVSDSVGRPVPGARIFLEGARREVVPSDRNGRFVLDVWIGPLDSLIREPVSLWLNARSTGWRLGIVGGAARLRIELGVFDDSLGARHVRVRTNDADATTALARGLVDGVLADTLEIGFVGEPGKDPEPRDVALDATADIVVVPGRVTSYTTPDTSDVPPSVTRPAQRTDEIALRMPSVPGDTCACRIEGTIEVQWDHPLPERVPVALWVEGRAAQRDSVELLLGSPRGFVVLASGCGPHRVLYATYSRLKFTRLTPDPVIECTDQGQRQLRIVLEPVRPRLPR